MKFYKLTLTALAVTLCLTTARAQTAVDEARSFWSQLLEQFNNGDYGSYLNGLADDMQGYAGVYTPFRFENKREWTTFINGLANYRTATYQQRDAEYRSIGPDVVLCNAYFTFTTVSQEGVMQVQNGRESTVIAKVDNRWKIVNYHFSGIF